MKVLMLLIAISITLVTLNWMDAPSTKPVPQQAASADNATATGDGGSNPSQATGAAVTVSDAAPHPSVEVAASAIPSVAAALLKDQEPATAQAAHEEVATASGMEDVPLPQVAHQAKKAPTASVAAVAAQPEQTARSLNKENMARMVELDKLFEH